LVNPIETPSIVSKAFCTSVSADDSNPLKLVVTTDVSEAVPEDPPVANSNADLSEFNRRFCNAYAMSISGNA
jgi:hypothetical protein